MSRIMTSLKHQLFQAEEPGSCGETTRRRRVFVNKEHQLRWMSQGGGSALNALQPIEPKARGRATSGKNAAASGRLDAMRPKAIETVKAITERFKNRSR